MQKDPISRPVSVNARHRDHTSSSPLTIVLKLGTSSICDELTYTPRLAVLSGIVETVVNLRNLGHRVVLVSSGAVGTGLRQLNLKEKPSEMSRKQAVAAVGQGRLLSLYDDLFKLFSIPIAQVLLTRSDIAERAQYQNACGTFSALLDMDVIPIVNENDTISVTGIRFGDNDTLSGLVAGMIDADVLFLLTDVDALYTDNPRTNPDAQIVRTVEDIASIGDKVSTETSGSTLGTGGMTTKLVAADLATAAGVSTIISLGSAPHRILSIIDYLYSSQDPSLPHPCPYTLFPAKSRLLGDRKWWIHHGLHSYGSIFIDTGAVKALIQNKSSLFATGITQSQGQYVAVQGVRVIWADRDLEVARGIVNYASNEVERVIGHHSTEFRSILGYADADCIIHRANLARTLDLSTLKDLLAEGE
ncbi:Aspartate/glutamate/uridylate kinase [Piptocephalis cylindrospora]|uniref:Aspartate/glutamate/uridylate kinase n=1 Tax=Piptocephalis cylindrospora TaxID=1907219 RepID=A0A4P9Y536_9FUNG|nr:Aspartate/glutamate/uridylate kinase [Piptocephalis cylindrospora]|eukprot:RKP14118.1 Aspartate/glutamate/uridylate kinase [Piptocephalis cylindrospora]